MSQIVSHVLLGNHDLEEVEAQSSSCSGGHLYGYRQNQIMV